MIWKCALGWCLVVILAARWFGPWAETVDRPEAFWAMVTAVATIAVAFVAWGQLKSIAATSRATFIYKLKLNFFRSRTRELLFLTKHHRLQFRPMPQPKELAFFEVLRDDGRLAERMDAMGISQETVSTEEVDDYLLGPLEDVAMFCKMNAISWKQACSEFRSHVNYIRNDCAIIKYIDWTRRNDQKIDQKNELEKPKNLWENLCEWFWYRFPKCSNKRRRRTGGWHKFLELCERCRKRR